MPVEVLGALIYGIIHLQQGSLDEASDSRHAPAGQATDLIIIAEVTRLARQDVYVDVWHALASLWAVLQSQAGS